jgi:hypothetical protein
VINFENVKIKQESEEIQFPEWARWLVNFGYKLDDIPSSVLMVLPIRDYAAHFILLGLMLRRLIKDRQDVAREWFFNLPVGTKFRSGRFKNCIYEGVKNIDGREAMLYRKRTASCICYFDNKDLDDLLDGYLSDCWRKLGNQVNGVDLGNNIAEAFGCSGYLMPPEYGSLVLCASTLADIADSSLEVVLGEGSKYLLQNLVMAAGHDEKHARFVRVKSRHGVDRDNYGDAWKNAAKGCNLTLMNGFEYKWCFTDSEKRTGTEKYLLIADRNECFSVNGDYGDHFKEIIKCFRSDIDIDENPEMGIFCYGISGVLS